MGTSQERGRCVEIRSFRPSDRDFLWAMLYPFIARLTRRVHRGTCSEIRTSGHYLEGFGGRYGDVAVVAVDHGEGEGAAWMRTFSRDAPGYGFLDSETPEIGMALLLEARGRGLGRRLLLTLLKRAQEHGFERVSLSVDARNVPTLTLYLTASFEVVGSESGVSLTMVRHLSPP